MRPDTDHGRGCLPILHQGSGSRKPDLEPRVEHSGRPISAKCPDNDNPCIPCAAGSILSTTMAAGGLGRSFGRREGISALRCLPPTENSIH